MSSRRNNETQNSSSCLVVGNDVTFIGVLMACSHAGLVEEARRHFKSMTECYGIQPREPHFGCMVDLFCRAGCLREAYDFIMAMPMRPNAVMWRTLLGTCSLHSNIELGTEVREKLLELDPDYVGDSVAMSNMYADKGKWNKKMTVRNEIKKSRSPGCSLIEVETKNHKSLWLYAKAFKHLKRGSNVQENSGALLRCFAIVLTLLIIPNTLEDILSLGSLDLSHLVGAELGGFTQMMFCGYNEGVNRKPYDEPEKLSILCQWFSASPLQMVFLRHLHLYFNLNKVKVFGTHVFQFIVEVASHHNLSYESDLKVVNCLDQFELFSSSSLIHALTSSVDPFLSAAF
ncbi:hypothetical protein K1719_002386 [Acacia pycnantha]|nr:hypothetical protein K1719_002386 [Acacia pycnantha]